MSCFKARTELYPAHCHDDEKADDRLPPPRMNALAAISAVLALPALTSGAYFCIAAARLRQWMDEPQPTSEDAAPLPPVTFFRPLKSGVPDLPAKLIMLADAMHPGDQLLLGADVDSAEWASAESVRRSFPNREVTTVSCLPGAALNPKISKLLQMEPLAKHEHWIVSDSEALTDASFLAAFRREWTRCDVLTTGYRFSNISTWPQRLDAAAVLLTLWPGLAVVRASGRVRFTLGACTGFRRSDVQVIGGWRAFAEDLAEDNRLGAALAATGRKIRLSTQVVTLESDPLSWSDYWRHQRRAAITYRIANPMGFAGAFLTQGVSTSLLLVCLRPMENWTWILFAAVFAIRCITAWDTSKKLAFSASRHAPAVLLASVIESACWVLSWGTRHVWWGGVRWRLQRGKLQRSEPA
jgi:ceramide glucosyltransferase